MLVPATSARKSLLDDQSPRKRRAKSGDVAARWSVTVSVAPGVTGPSPPNVSDEAPRAILDAAPRARLAKVCPFAPPAFSRRSVPPSSASALAAPMRCAPSRTSSPPLTIVEPP